MHTTYSIEKVAAHTRREAIAAAEARAVARAFRRTPAASSESPSSGTVRAPRPRRWFGVAVASR